jgi:hypothetical protein
MTPLLKLLENRAMMFMMGTIGDSCTLTGIVCAMKDKKVLGMGSQTWFMIAYVHYLYFIMSILSRQLAAIEND